MADAFPPRPHLGQLKRQARELLTAARNGETTAIDLLSSDRVSTPKLSQALSAVAKRYGFASWPELKHHVIAVCAAEPAPLVRFAEKLLVQHRERETSALNRIRQSLPRFAFHDDEALASAKLSIVDARDVIAKESGFHSWTDLLSHQRGETSVEFERAVDCVVLGKLDELRELLSRNPLLAKQRSSFAHRATLLHYVTANGVEDERQQVPENAVAIANALLEAGADPDSLSQSYGGGRAQTPLCLLCSSAHPDAAGLTGALVDTLCTFGANANGLDDDGLPMATAIAFCITTAIAPLAEHGARIDNIVFAAAAGDSQRVTEMLGPDRLPKREFCRRQIGSFTLSDKPSQAISQAFVYACLHDRTSMIARLASLGVSPNSQLPSAETGLHWAATKNRFALAKQLVDLGATASPRDARWNASPLDWAANSNHDEMVDWLLHNAQPDLVDLVRYGSESTVAAKLADSDVSADGPQCDGQPLRTAVSRMSEDVVATLLAAGADVNLADQSGKLPLHCAAEVGSVPIAKSLIEAGADVDRTSNWEMTPLEWAVNADQRDVASLLADHGAKHSLFVKAGLGQTTLLDAMLAKHPDETDVSNALYIASRNGHAEAVERLLSAGADPNYVGPLGGTPLHWAALNGHLPVVQRLVSAGADIQLRDERFRSLPAGWANEQGRQDVLGWLIEAGTQLNIREAAEFGCENIVREFVEEDSHWVTFSDGSTPLQAARRRGHGRIESLLIEAGAER